MTSRFETSFYTVVQSDYSPILDPALIDFLFIPSDDITYYERSIYNLLDFLGDIGGFSEFLDEIAMLILMIVSSAIGDGPHIYMIENVFKTKDKH